MSDKVISFIQPSRNNLKYLKWSYNSIRKNLGYRHEICWADDFSDDGTWEWMNEIVKKDKNVQIYRNNGPERQGHTAAGATHPRPGDRRRHACAV